jgi:hypothetical protein
MSTHLGEDFESGDWRLALSSFGLVLKGRIRLLSSAVFGNPLVQLHFPRMEFVLLAGFPQNSS